MSQPITYRRPAILLVVISFFLFNSCGETTPKEVQQSGFSFSNEAEKLYQITGEKHDTAMLLMTDIELSNSRLRMIMKKIEGTSPRKDSILGLLTELKKADDGMMNWMRAFKNPLLNEEDYLAMSEEQIMAYLKEEERKIEQVHLDMTQSLDNASRFFDKE